MTDRSKTPTATDAAASGATAEGWRRWLHANRVRHWLLFLCIGAIAVMSFGQILEALDPWLPGSRLMASYTVRGVFVVGVLIWLGRVQKVRHLDSYSEVS